MMTRREKMVKKRLLKELRRINGGEILGGLSYAQKQHLEKTINVDFIDREIEIEERHTVRTRAYTH